jgi:hypothetical protein
LKKTEEDSKKRGWSIGTFKKDIEGRKTEGELRETFKALQY